MSEPDPNLQAQAEDAAREYAWQWFQYHAGQRQAVLRFYLIMIGVASTGYVTSMTAPGLRSVAFLFGALLIVLSLLFWRLDARSIKLIKLAEAYLKKEEERLESIVRHPEIRLAHRADVERDTRFLLNRMYSFRQIYQIIFSLVSILGFAIFMFDSDSPILEWIQLTFRSNGIS